MCVCVSGCGTVIPMTKILLTRTKSSTLTATRLPPVSCRTSASARSQVSVRLTQGLFCPQNKQDKMLSCLFTTFSLLTHNKKKPAAHPSNVEIDTCSGGDNQLWTYNQQDSTLRLSHNTNLCLDVGSLATCQISPWNTYPYCQDSLDRDARANDLLNRLTLEDKVCVLLSNEGDSQR